MDPSILLTLLSAAILLITIAAIQISQQKKYISELEGNIKKHLETIRLTELKQIANLEEIRWLKWQIANPHKYKRGNKFGDLIVLSHEFYRPGIGKFILSAISTLVGAFFFHKDKKYIDSLDEKFKEKTDPQYMYHLANTVSGEKFYMRETDLTDLIPEEKK